LKLITTSLFSGLITLIRLASGFIVLKFVALFTGPSGVALIGGFQNFISIILTFGNGAINNGVVKYTAEYAKDVEKTKNLFSTAFRITVFFSAIIGLILLLCAPYIADFIFENDVYVNSIRILGVTLVLYTLNILIVTILNGKGLIKTYSIVNIFGSIVGLIFTVILVYYYGIQGALISLVLTQSIVFIITCFFVRKYSWFSLSYIRNKFDKAEAIKLSHFSLMAIVSALTVPVSQILIRNLVSSKLTILQAGQWQGMLKISDSYLMLITTSLTTYYLPKLSSLKDKEDIKNEIVKGYKIILPFVITSCLIIYFLRDWIIRLLYSEAFAAMESLFLWQLLGDLFKISAWILGYVLVAKAEIKMFIILEIVFNSTYVLFAYLLLKRNDLEGVTMAYTLNYLIFLIVMIIIFKSMILKRGYE
jgi:PST family polysaccharide transporter